MTKKKTTCSVPPLEMALDVSNHVELEDIALIKNGCQLYPVAQGKKGEYDYSISASTDYSEDADNNVLLVQVKLNFNAKNENAENIVSLRAEYIAVYSVKVKREFSVEHYINFSEYCSVFHVWPYWREFVQRSIADFRLPPLTLPVFRFGSKLPGDSPLTSKKQAILQEKETMQAAHEPSKTTTKKSAAKKRKQHRK